MIDFTVPDEVRAHVDRVLAFVDAEVLPLEEEHRELVEDERRCFDPTGRFAPELLELLRVVRTRSATAGIYTMFGSARLGGAGLGPIVAMFVNEQMYRRHGPGRFLIKEGVFPSSFTSGLSRLLEHVDADVLAPRLAAIASGHTTLCFALSEPAAGSDVYAIESRARRDGDDWVLDGTKEWVRNGPYADHAIVFAVSDPESAARRRGGITAFLVDTSWPGFEVRRAVPLMGHLGSDLGTIDLVDLRVPASHVIGEVHRGLDLALDGIATGRLTLASSCVGYAEWGLDKALAYAEERVTFGRPIIEHQAIEMHLAECAMDVYATKAMLRHAAWLVSAGSPAIKELSMLKAQSTEMFFRVMDRAIQVCGAVGLTNDFRLEAGIRLARTMRVPDGTGEIQRRTVVRQMRKGDRDILAVPRPSG